MLQRVLVRAVEDRRSRGTKNPWLLRWSVDGRVRSMSFETRALAEDFAARLREAKRSGCHFDQVTGLPEDWTASDETLLDWSHTWFNREKSTWSKRSRTSVKEALARAVVLGVHEKAPTPPAGIRSYVMQVLNGETKDLDQACGAWLSRWGLSLSQLDRAAVRRIFDGLGINDSGGPYKPATSGRFRKVTRQMYEAAVELRKLPQSNWPAPRRGKRRMENVPQETDIASLPSPEVMRRIIDGLVSHQPGSIGYRVLSLAAWMLGTRPSETLALRVEDFVLPETGPGTVRIHRSLDEDGQEGMTKTGRERTISVPTALVGVLREYLGERTTGPLVTTRSGNPPALSNWLRALYRSCDKLGVGRIAPYDFRHSCASMLLAETKAPGAVADRLGNSVEVLLRYYAAALDGQDRIVADAAERLFG